MKMKNSLDLSKNTNYSLLIMFVVIRTCLIHIPITSRLV